MDKSQVLKYLQEIWEDLDTIDTDFHRALSAIDGFDIKRSDLVLDGRYRESVTAYCRAWH